MISRCLAALSKEMAVNYAIGGDNSERGDGYTISPRMRRRKVLLHRTELRTTRFTKTGHCQHVSVRRCGPDSVTDRLYIRHRADTYVK